LKNQYQIRWPYRSRGVYHHHDDMDLTDEWQREVYLHAHQTMIENHFKSVLDIGCGSGYKLAQYLGEFDTIGLELECNIAALQQRYPQRRWEKCDLTRPISQPVDLIICADVIEHLVDPDQLIRFIQQTQFQRLIFSTPDRSLLYRPWKRRYWGPPRNSAHQREWTFREFSRYISGSFEILDHRISNRQQATQMVTCKSPHRWPVGGESRAMVENDGAE
jgi:SAM-dependent methyltransferase